MVSNISSLTKAREQYFGIVIDSLENKQAKLKPIIAKGLKAQYITNLLSRIASKIGEGLEELITNSDLLFEIHTNSGFTIEDLTRMLANSRAHIGRSIKDLYVRKDALNTFIREGEFNNKQLSM